MVPKQPLLRTFDPVKNQHPVSWLLENVKIDIYQPLHDWLATEILEEAMPEPSTLNFPD